MITTSLQTKYTVPTNISPGWYSSERYDYCDTLILKKRPSAIRYLIEVLKEKISMSVARMERLSVA